MDIDREGTFRGVIQEGGVGETKNGYPQYVLRVLADEFYDTEAEGGPAWTPWAEYQQEITGFLCLYTKDSKTGQWKELMNAGQLKKAIGWTGKSFEELNTLGNGKRILFRVEEDDYNGQVKLKVQWIDAVDADPVRQLAKATPEKIKAMDAAFAGVLQAAPVAPAKAPATAVPGGVHPTSGPKPPAKRGPKPKPQVPATTPPADPTPSAAPAPSTAAPAPAATPAAPSVTPPTAAPAAPTTPAPCTKEEAWAAACMNTMRAADDAKIAEVWVQVVTSLNTPEDQITPAQWGQVRDGVIDKTSKF
jgi:hypothetical protein